MNNLELKKKRERLLAMELEEKNNKNNVNNTDVLNSVDDKSELFFTKKECDKITNYDQLKQISLNEQQKLHELGAELALKNARIKEGEQKWDDLIKYFNEKMNDNENNEVVSVIKRDLKSFIDISVNTKKKLNKEIKLLNETNKDLNEGQEDYEVEIIELENKIVKIEKDNKNELLKHKNNYKILEKKRTVEIIILLLFNLITIDFSCNGYNSITIYTIHNIYSYIIIASGIFFLIIKNMLDYFYKFISETIFNLF